MGYRQNIWYKIINNERLYMIRSCKNLIWEHQFPISDFLFKNYCDILVSLSLFFFFSRFFGGEGGWRGTGVSEPLGVKHAPILSRVQLFTRLKSITNCAAPCLQTFSFGTSNMARVLLWGQVTLGPMHQQRAR